jgi:hypothetical protein
MERNITLEDISKRIDESNSKLDKLQERLDKYYKNKKEQVLEFFNPNLTDYISNFLKQEKENGKTGLVIYSATDLFDKVKPFYTGGTELTQTMLGRHLRGMDNVTKLRTSKFAQYRFVI